MMEKLRGIRTPAWLTGFLRGLLEAGALGALYMALDAVTTANLPSDYAWIAFVAPLVVRSIEGTIDHIDPVKVRRRAVADEAV